jgi:hypothetical protein
MLHGKLMLHEKRTVSGVPRMAAEMLPVMSTVTPRALISDAGHSHAWGTWADLRGVTHASCDEVPPPPGPLCTHRWHPDLTTPPAAARNPPSPVRARGQGCVVPSAGPRQQAAGTHNLPAAQHH